MSLLAELKRRKVFRVSIAYLVAGWIVIQVATTVVPHLALPAWVPRFVTLIVLLGFPVAVVLAWAFDLTPSGVRRAPQLRTGPSVYLLAVLLAAAASAWYVLSGPVDEEPAPTSIAVLPFVNMSSDPENEYLADGISEEILNSLVAAGELDVVGRTSSFRFKERNEDLRTIGALLDVANILEGSVRRTGDRVRVTAQLVRTSDGYHLWSETYDRTLTDILDVQLDIAESVNRALDVVLDDMQRKRMFDAQVRDVEAYIAFQKGRELFNRSHSQGIDMEMLEQSAVHFSTAIEREPAFAEAYLFRADYWSHILQDKVDESTLDTAYKNYLSDLRAAHSYAVSPVMRAHSMLGYTLASDSWRTLAADWEAMLRTDGCVTAGWEEVGVVLGYEQKLHEQALRQLRCGPMDITHYYSVMKTAVWAGRPKTALEWRDKAHGRIEDSLLLLSLQISALLILEQPDKARKLLPSQQINNMYAAMIAAADGRVEEARAFASAATPGQDTSWVDINALVASAAAGERDLANQFAAHLDGNPIGPMQLLWATSACLCGAPFDLDATPNFAARLKESGLPWPPPARIRMPAKDW